MIVRHWPSQNKKRNNLQNSQKSMERSMAGIHIHRTENVSIEQLRAKTGVVDILTRIYQQKWRWTSHMMRGKMVKDKTDWYLSDVKCSRGKQLKRWEDELRLTAGPNWRRVARDRVQ